MLIKIKKTIMYFLVVIVAYLAVGYFLHLVVFPEKRPDLAEYFKPGAEFFSKTENVRQVVVKHEGGIVFCAPEIGPFAGGPPKHIHTTFDEVFEIANGTLTVWVDGKIIRLKPGEKLRIPKGTPHTPYNETGDTIRTKGTVPFPEKFAFGLSQVYGVLDNDPSFGKSPKTILQMAMFSANGFDSELAEGPPVFVQKVTTFLVVPLARLLGYKSYYREYDIRTRKYN
jgi:mannose-6-phosphate isomerase-like protein (cupin superfamily)